jgi:hypothetical protein
MRDACPPADARQGPAQPGQPIVRRRAPCQADERMCELKLASGHPGPQALELIYWSWKAVAGVPVSYCLCSEQFRPLFASPDNGEIGCDGVTLLC